MYTGIYFLPGQSAICKVCNVPRLSIKFIIIITVILPGLQNKLQQPCIIIVHE